MWLPSVPHALASANTYREILATAKAPQQRDSLMQEVIALSDEVIRLRIAQSQSESMIARLQATVLVLEEKEQTHGGK